MKNPLIAIILIYWGLLSCNNSNNDSYKSDNLLSNKKSNGFHITYFDSDFNEVSSKSSAAYYREGYYLNGQPLTDSLTKDYYITGELQFKGHLKSENPDVLYGKCTWYYKNGNTEIEYSLNENGEIEGPTYSYYENGAKKVISNYSNGKVEGHYTEFYINGKKKADYYFKKKWTK